MKVLGIYDKFSRKEIFIPLTDNAEKADLQHGSFVVYHDDDSKENIGRVHFSNREIKDEDKILKQYSFLRKATANDLQKMEMQKSRAQEAIGKCQEKIKEHKLDMQLIFTEYSLDGGRINFIFTADDRVDFRELVKDLAKIFQKQIHLQQIGPRDKARIVTGRGKCGKPLCCSSWLSGLESITMEMVRQQSLENKGSAKLSGACGKLMCCLRYEASSYRDLRKSMPELGDIVKVKKGEAEVVSLDVLNDKIRVLYKDRSTEVVSQKDIKKIIKTGHRPTKRAAAPVKG